MLKERRMFHFYRGFFWPFQLWLLEHLFIYLFIYLLIYLFFKVDKFIKFPFTIKKIALTKFCYANLRQIPI